MFMSKREMDDLLAMLADDSPSPESPLTAKWEIPSTGADINMAELARLIKQMYMEVPMGGKGSRLLGQIIEAVGISNADIDPYDDDHEPGGAG